MNYANCGQHESSQPHRPSPSLQTSLMHAWRMRYNLRFESHQRRSIHSVRTGPAHWHRHIDRQVIRNLDMGLSVSMDSQILRWFVRARLLRSRPNRTNDGSLAYTHAIELWSDTKGLRKNRDFDVNDVDRQVPHLSHRMYY
jgi:hypothetical protein